MGRTPQEDLLIERRRSHVSELYLQAWTQAQIAAQLGISRSTVLRDLEAIRQAWAKSSLRNFDEAVAIELAKLDRLEREAWEAWERSKTPQETTKVTSKGERKEAEKITRHQPGDPRYLEIAHRCVAARRALLGLDPPTRIAATSPDGKEAYDAHVIGRLMELAEGARGGADVIDADFISAEVERIADQRQPSAGKTNLGKKE